MKRCTPKNIWLYHHQTHNKHIELETIPSSVLLLPFCSELKTLISIMSNVLINEIEKVKHIVMKTNKKIESVDEGKHLVLRRKKNHETIASSLSLKTPELRGEPWIERSCPIHPKMKTEWLEAADPEVRLRKSGWILKHWCSTAEKELSETLKLKNHGWEEKVP